MIGIVGVLAFGATKAVWSDSARSTGNTFQAGTLDLKVGNSVDPGTDSTSLTWNGANMYPGGPTVDATLHLKNGGNVAGDHIHFSVANSDTATAGMAKYLEISTLDYDGNSILGELSDVNKNGIIDLDDWQQLGLIGDHTGFGRNILVDGGHTLRMVVGLKGGFDPLNTTPDSIQGDTGTTDLTATLHQADGQ